MSDIDVLVHGDRVLTLREEADLRAALAAAFDTIDERIDVVFLPRANALLAYEALWHGKVLWGNEETVHALQVRAWKRFQEARKFSRRRHEFLMHAFAPPAAV